MHRTVTLPEPARLEISQANRVQIAVVATLLGAFLLLGVGFAHPNVLHNAAHDGRHAFSFPCH